MAVDVAVLARRIRAAQGLEPCDVCIQGGQLVDVATGTVRPEPHPVESSRSDPVPATARSSRPLTSRIPLPARWPEDTSTSIRR